MKNDLLEEVKRTKEQLLETLALFDDKDINTIPFEGSWTGGQVAEHVLKSLSGALTNVTGAVKPTERAPDVHVKELRNIFLDMNIKMKSPEAIIPSDELKNKEALAAKLSEKLDGLKSVAANDDLTQTCTLFEMYKMGALTRLEWISFSMYHTQRHTNQLKNIIEHLHRDN
jgi:hypothetical protein